MTVVFFDLDGTLLKNPSSESRFIWYLFCQRQLKLSHVWAAVQFSIRYFQKYGSQVWKKNKAYLSGQSSLKIERLAEKFVEERLLPLLRKELLEELQMHQANGSVTVLLTGTPEFIAKPLARHLQFSHCIATACPASEGKFLADPPLQHPFREEKVELAWHFCSSMGESLSEAVAYADSADDFFLFSEVEKAILVSSNPKLRNFAEMQKWRVILAKGNKEKKNSCLT